MRCYVLVALSSVVLSCVSDSGPISNDGGEDGAPIDGTTSDGMTNADATADAADGGGAQYSPSLSDKSKWDTVDITSFSMQNGASGVFDGKYVYFIGDKILQYDTTKPFMTASTITPVAITT